MNKIRKSNPAKIRTLFVIDFNSIEDHVKWLNQNRVNKHDLRSYPAKAIQLDFSRVRFLKPYHIAPLACLIHEYRSKGFSIKLVKIPDQIREYLASFEFDQFCSGKDVNTAIPSDIKTFPLWHIDETGKDLYSIRVQQYFENNHFAGFDLFTLGNSLAELMNNIFDHAQSKIPGYTFTQLNTRNSQIIACVCDFGIGIPASVNKFLESSGKKKIANDMALRKAMELNFTSLTRPHNRGFGWNTIESSIKSLQGKFLIVSNNALFLMQQDGSFRSHLIDTNFPGTLVVIYLDIKKLPAKEDELVDELALL